MNERDTLFLVHVLDATAETESFSVDLTAVWSMIEQDLPALRINVRRLLDGAAGH